MNKRIYALISLVIFGGVCFYLFSTRCEQPDKLTIALSQLQCANSISVPSIRTKACLSIYGKEECEFKQEDLAVIEQLFMKQVNDCAKLTLESQNKCIDKYEDL